MVNPALVEKLGMRLRLLKVPMMFCQLNVSIAREIPATFVTELIRCG